MLDKATRWITFDGDENLLEDVLDDALRGRDVTRRIKSGVLEIESPSYHLLQIALRAAQSMSDIVHLHTVDPRVPATAKTSA